VQGTSLALGEGGTACQVICLPVQEWKCDPTIVVINRVRYPSVDRRGYFSIQLNYKAMMGLEHGLVDCAAQIHLRHHEWTLETEEDVEE
jgi:hypothetical protein